MKKKKESNKAIDEIIKNRKRVLAIYSRQSRTKDTSNSIDDQKSEGRKQAELLNIPFEDYIDRGQSAIYDNLDNRPSFVKLLRDIKAGIISEVFVIDDTRLSRNQTTKIAIKSIFSEYKIKVYSKLDGIIDFDDSNSEFFSDLRTLFGHKQVKDSSSKIRISLRNKAKEGKAGGGACMPYGWKKDNEKFLVHNEEEIPIYNQMVEWCFQGTGTGTIAKRLNEMGVPTKGRKFYTNGIKFEDEITGKITVIKNSEIDWAPGTIYSILTNPLYKGERNFRGEVFEVKPVISKEKWDELQLALTRNAKFSPKNNKTHFYLLKGLLTCNRCGRNLYGVIKPPPIKTQNVYMCSSKREKFCGMKSINIPRLNNLIWRFVSDSDFFINKVVKEFQLTDTVSRLKDIESRILEKENQLVSIEKKRKKILDLWEDDELSPKEFKERNSGHDKAMKETTKQINFLLEKRKFTENTKFQEQRLIDFAVKVCTVVNNYNEEERRAFLVELIKEIVIEFDNINNRHIVTCYFSFDALINKPAEFTINLNGVSNYVGPKYNEFEFNDKFNQRPHMLIEKFKKPAELPWNENFAESIAPVPPH